MIKSLTVLMTTLFLLQTVAARTVEIDVHGMTCPFCVDSLERKFKKMPAVKKVEISLKHKKVRLETEANTPKLEAIKQAVLDAGFTPTKVTVIAEEKASVAEGGVIKEETASETKVSPKDE